MCSVDKTGCEAIITQRALVFLSAVASRFRSCGGSAENFVVMLLNDAFHVIHTAVANFNCVFVENFVVPMVFRKVLLDQAQKYFSDVCLDVLTKRRIEPDDVSFSASVRSLCAGVCYDVTRAKCPYSKLSVQANSRKNKRFSSLF